MCPPSSPFLLRCLIIQVRLSERRRGKGGGGGGGGKSSLLSRWIKKNGDGGEEEEDEEEEASSLDATMAFDSPPDRLQNDGRTF